MLSFPVKPMLLQTAKEPFNSSDYVFEWKVDGIRCMAFYDHGQVRLQSKTGRDCTKAFPEFWELPVKAEEIILDGEVTVITDGKPDFEGVMKRYLANPSKVDKPAAYIVWDILWCNGERVSDLALVNRKQLLNSIFKDNDVARKIEWVDNDGLALWQGIKVQGLEGMVAKKKNSRYVFGQRSSAWLKVKNYQEAVVNVFGYSQKEGTVLVGSQDKVQGRTLGMQKEERAVLRELIDKYGTPKGNVIWLPRGLKGRVKFTTWTPRGYMRDCSWIRFEI